jgi:hypothetical protein
MGRPQKAVATMMLWAQRACRSTDIEYVFSVHDHDPTGFQLLEHIGDESVPFARVHVCSTDLRGSAANWNTAAIASKGDLLVQAQDDLEPPPGWDHELLHRLQAHFLEGWRHAPAFIAVSDGHRKDRLCVTSIMTRPYMEVKGHFLCPEYPGVVADSENTYRAYRDARDHRVILIEARELVFLHRHHYHDKSVAWDPTYAAENDPAAYRRGSELFEKRNPEAKTDGLCTWR